MGCLHSKNTQSSIVTNDNNTTVDARSRSVSYEIEAHSTSVTDKYQSEIQLDSSNTKSAEKVDTEDSKNKISESEKYANKIESPVIAWSSLERERPLQEIDQSSEEFGRTITSTEIASTSKDLVVHSSPSPIEDIANGKNISVTIPLQTDLLTISNPLLQSEKSLLPSNLQNDDLVTEFVSSNSFSRSADELPVINPNDSTSQVSETHVKDSREKSTDDFMRKIFDLDERDVFQCYSWLAPHHLSRYCSLFSICGYTDGDVVLPLSKSDLEELEEFSGYRLPPGHRKMLLAIRREDKRYDYEHFLKHFKWERGDYNRRNHEIDENTIKQKRDADQVLISSESYTEDLLLSIQRRNSLKLSPMHEIKNSNPETKVKGPSQKTLENSERLQETESIYHSPIMIREEDDRTLSRPSNSTSKGLNNNSKSLKNNNIDADKDDDSSTRSRRKSSVLDIVMEDVIVVDASSQYESQDVVDSSLTGRVDTHYSLLLPTGKNQLKMVDSSSSPIEELIEQDKYSSDENDTENVLLDKESMNMITTGSQTTVQLYDRALSPLPLQQSDIDPNPVNLQISVHDEVALNVNVSGDKLIREKIAESTTQRTHRYVEEDNRNISVNDSNSSSDEEYDVSRKKVHSSSVVSSKKKSSFERSTNSHESSFDQHQNETVSLSKPREGLILEIPIERSLSPERFRKSMENPVTKLQHSVRANSQQTPPRSPIRLRSPLTTTTSTGTSTTPNHEALEAAEAIRSAASSIRALRMSKDSRRKRKGTQKQASDMNSGHGEIGDNFLSMSTSMKRVRDKNDESEQENTESERLMLASSKSPGLSKPKPSAVTLEYQKSYISSPVAQQLDSIHQHLQER